MKVFFCIDHEGFYPAGTASCVVAETKEKARKMLVKQLKEHGITQSEPFTLIEIDVTTPAAYVLNDGNY